MKKLLCRPEIHENECLVSYMIRVAEVNGFKHIGYLLNFAGLGWKNNRAPIHQLITGQKNIQPLLSRLGLEESISQASFALKKFECKIDTSHIIAKHPKVCPKCIEEQGYCHYQWVFLPVVVCLKHNVTLIDKNSKTGKPLSWYRQRLDRFDGNSLFTESLIPKCQSSSIQITKLFVTLLEGKSTLTFVPQVLHGLEFKEALSMVNLLAHYQCRVKGIKYRPVSLGNMWVTQIYTDVWKMLLGWPDTFYELLSQYLHRPMSTRGVTGINKSFRDLHEQLHRQKKNEGVQRIKTEFDRFIETRWPTVLEGGRFTRINLSSENQELISKREACKILNCRAERIYKYVQQSRLSVTVFKGRSSYSRSEVNSLANLIESNWSLAQACDELQVSRFQLKQLLDSGLLPVLQKSDTQNRDWLIDKKGCIEIMDRLKIKAEPEAGPGKKYSLAGIQRIGFSIVDLIAAMDEGRLAYCIQKNSGKIYSFHQFCMFTRL